MSEACVAVVIKRITPQVFYVTKLLLSLCKNNQRQHFHVFKFSFYKADYCCQAICTFVSVCLHPCVFVCTYSCLPAGKVSPVLGRLEMQPVFVQSVTVKLYTW